jgi:hypothetical protein
LFFEGPKGQDNLKRCGGVSSLQTTVSAQPGRENSIVRLHKICFTQAPIVPKGLFYQSTGPIIRNFTANQLDSDLASKGAKHTAVIFIQGYIRQ